MSKPEGLQFSPGTTGLTTKKVFSKNPFLSRTVPLCEQQMIYSIDSNFSTRAFAMINTVY